MAQKEERSQEDEDSGKKPKLAAANGTAIEVDGEATLEFEMQGRLCGISFLDADVKKPLGGR